MHDSAISQPQDEEVIAVVAWNTGASKVSYEHIRQL